MSLIFFGTGSFAIPSLRILANDVSLVVTQPDRPSGRGLRLTPSPIKLQAIELGLPVETPEKSRAPEWIERFLEIKPDALVVASYGQILSQRLLDTAKFGGINLHGSILPKYRGAAPIQRCLLNGEPQTGVTLMQMDKGMDTGAIIDIRRCEILADETYGDLQFRLAAIAAEMAQEWMPRIVAGNYPIQPQINEDATYAAKIEKSEAELIFGRPAHEEYARFRAFTPEPGAFVRSAHGLLRLSQARLSERLGEPSEVISTSPLTVGFLNGSIELHEVQPEGKKRMTGRDFANGARLRPGSRLV
ncbi:MAG: methionyl-tRNA formyltransferase [Fimbriimonas sp.]|nr:methionyl-tRNA formyltransferase [Fimbriimonas sp.]